jgi:hypothetical protein
MTAYDGAQLFAEWQDGAVWVTLDIASVSIVSAYDVGQSGVALYNPPTATISFSRKGNAVTDPLALAVRCRIRYGALVLFEGYVTDLAHTFVAQPPVVGLTATLISVEGMLLAEQTSWPAHAAEDADVRLLRCFDSVVLNGITPPLSPPEEAGSATRLDVLRAFSDAIGLPVYLRDESTPVVFTTADTPPAGLDDDAAASRLYATATHTASAGDRVLSNSPGDRSYKASATLKADLVDVVLSSYRVPQALALPFADPLRTSRFEMAYSPQHCSGAVDFDQPTVNVMRYRPPAVPYEPGSTTTPLTGGQPWSETTPYPPGAVVSHDGHLYRAPAVMPAGTVPGAAPVPAFTDVTLTDAYYGNGLTFGAVATSSVDTDGLITYRLDFPSGDAHDRATPLATYALGGPYPTMIHNASLVVSGEVLPYDQDPFDPDDIAWDTNGDYSADTVIPGAFTGLVLRQSTAGHYHSDGDYYDGTYYGTWDGPIVATYPFGNAIAAAAPVWTRMV